MRGWGWTISFGLMACVFAFCLSAFVHFGDQLLSWSALAMCVGCVLCAVVLVPERGR